MIVVGGKEYKVKFGYNSLCDTDLLDRVGKLGSLFSGANAENDSDVQQLGKVRELFCIVRELLFVGFKRFNPVESEQDVGNLLDQYKEEQKDGEGGLFQLFTMLSNELMNEGFLSDLMKGDPTSQKAAAPRDHKKSTRK